MFRDLYWKKGVSWIRRLKQYEQVLFLLLLHQMNQDQKNTMPRSNLLTANGYAEMVVRHPIWVCLISLILVMISALGVRHIGFSSDYRDFFSEDNKYLVSFDNLQDTFSRDDSIFILIHNEEGEVFEKQVLMLVKELTKQAWETPFASRVDSLSNFQHSWANNDDLYVDCLLYTSPSPRDATLSRMPSSA